MALPLRQTKSYFEQTLNMRKTGGLSSDGSPSLLRQLLHSVRFTARRVRPAAHANYRPRGVLGSLLRSWATDFNMPALSRTATSPTTCDNCPEIDLAHNADTCQVYNGSDISRRGMIMPQHAKENSGPSGNTQVILQQMESCL